MICKKCNTELEQGAVFCHVCGTPVPGETSKTFCAKCGKELVDGAAFCVSCGTSVQEMMHKDVATQIKGKKKRAIGKVVLILLCAAILIGCSYFVLNRFLLGSGSDNYLYNQDSLYLNSMGDTCYLYDKNMNATELEGYGYLLTSGDNASALYIGEPTSYFRKGMLTSISDYNNGADISFDGNAVAFIRGSHDDPNMGLYLFRDGKLTLLCDDDSVGSYYLSPDGIKVVFKYPVRHGGKLNRASILPVICVYTHH